MTATEDSTTQSPPTFLPANRKRCFVCSKCVYLHQPLLYCTKCENIFHGKCLNITNSQIFLLQQLPWHCDSCSVYNNIDCSVCNFPIFITSNPFQICKNCFKSVHKTCSYRKTCLNCIPEFKPTQNSIDISPLDFSPLDDDYYKNLPYFNPFEELSENISHEITECDEVYENFSTNSNILNLCEYYEISKFAKKVKSFDKNKFILIGLNIDGFKTNFDNFRIFANELSKMKLEISCFGLCETNILDVESDMFYIDGYNKFILDKLNFENEKIKKKVLNFSNLSH